jgi:RNA polymerase sigma-70 factor (ECF subfamily)
MNKESTQNIFENDPDVQLMLSFQQGDKASFESLMRKYYPRLLNFIYRFLGDQALAEDIAQETFIKVYQNAGRYKPQSKFSTWLYTIAKNLSLNELRKRKQIAFSLNETFTDGDEEVINRIEDEAAVYPVEKLISEEKSEAVKKAIDELPENQRMAIILLRYENFSYEEIAKTMGASVSAVKSLLSRAKETLRVKLLKLVD